MPQALTIYAYLQLLDFLTTIAFLFHGVREGNPIVRLAMDHSASPLLALAILKVLALALGLYCWRLDNRGVPGKRALLGRVNAMFAVLVAWNVVALILSAPPAGRMV